MIAHSEKEQAAPTWKKTFGFHPMTAWADHGADGNGEPLAIVLRPGTPGRTPPPTTSRPPGSRWRSCPATCAARCWSGPTPAAARTSSWNGSTARSRRLHYSVGMTITEDMQAAIGKSRSRVDAGL